MIRQSPCDLRSTSNSPSSSSSSIIYPPSRCASTSQTTLDHLAIQSRVTNALENVEIASEVRLSATPDDEACFVDFEQKQVGKWALRGVSLISSRLLRDTASDTFLHSQTSSHYFHLRLRPIFYPSSHTTTTFSLAPSSQRVGTHFATTRRYGYVNSRIAKKMAGN